MNTRFQRICLLLALAAFASPYLAAQSPSQTLLTGYEPSFALLRDTLHVLDSTFLEVRLNEQAIYQHFRSGRVVRYSCSTGDPRIKDGIATREGIYAIQWKSKKHMSRQFQCYLNYWMPFDGGIGFHGLEGTSYYRYLGRRPSSHGCVRIANETGAKLFRDAPRGTVVWVHGGSPARLLRFSDSSSQTLLVVGADDEILDARLRAVVERRLDDSVLARRVAIRGGRPFAGRIAVGRVERMNRVDRPLPLVVTAPRAIDARRERPAEARPLPGRHEEMSILDWEAD